MARNLIDSLDEINGHLSALTALTLAVDNLEDAGEREIECVTVTMNYHIEKAREIQKEMSEWYRKTKK